MASNDCVVGHTAYIYDRGGMTRVAQLTNLSSVTWQRSRDATSEATVVITGSNCWDQQDVLSAIEPHRSEMVIFRGDDRVWEGPVRRVGWEPDRVEIVAHDVSEYVQYTIMARGYSNANPNITEVTTRIGNIILFEFENNYTLVDEDGTSIPITAWENLDPPANVTPFLTVHHWPNEARTAAVTTPFQMTVGEHLQNLAAQSGIDFTVVGRAIHIWDTSRNLGMLQQLTDSDFNNGVIVTAYGADHASQAFVPSDGNDPAGTTVVGMAGADDLYYGPWAQVYTSFNEDTTGATAPSAAELSSQAARNLTGRIPVPIEVRVPDNSTVFLTDSLTIDDLVPGVQVPLLATLNARQVSQLQKIDLVNITETGDQGENITVTLSPATKPDSDDEDDDD
jgi:hypothetical protein